MHHVTRWLAILLVVGAPLGALAQGSGDGREPYPDRGYERVSDQDAGSAMPRFASDERHSRPQRVILVMLATLCAATLVFGVATIAYAFRDRWAHRHRR